MSGYCYSVIESLIVGTPCVVTPCPVFKELGLNKENSITLNFDCSNVDEIIDKMLEKYDFKYVPKKDNWNNILIKGKSTYKEEKDMLVKATDKYEKLGLKDCELDRIPKAGEQFEVSAERYKVLTETNKYNVEFVEKVEEEKASKEDEVIVETATKKVKTEKAVKKTTKKAK